MTRRVIHIVRGRGRPLGVEPQDRVIDLSQPDAPLADGEPLAIDDLVRHIFEHDHVVVW